MIKTILVPVGGSATDASTFATALATAKLFAAHLAFFHVRIGAAEAVAYTPHADFAQGAGSLHVLERLTKESENRASNARRHVAEFCADQHLVLDEVSPPDHLSASWCEESHNALERLMSRSRHYDLVVMGRGARPNGLPRNLLGRLLLGCGRPILIAPREARSDGNRTVVVCWQETPQAARALTASMPFLTRAKRVVFLSVDEKDANAADALQDIARKMVWHGVTAETKLIESDRRATAHQLFAAAQELGADLVVMGSHSHSRTHEMIFGSCTQSALDDAALPVLIVH